MNYLKHYATLLGMMGIVLFSLGTTVAANDTVCTMEYDPVCGVDGNTYGNDCMAGDVEISHQGVCDAGELTGCDNVYAPVCGKLDVQCIKAPCPPIYITYGNRCYADDAGATDILLGTCAENGLDDDSMDTPLEGQALVQRAHSQGITRYDTLADFRYDDYLIREEAAKMLMTALQESLGELREVEDPQFSCDWKDNDAIDPTLLDAIKDACHQGLFKGAPDGTFMPHRWIIDTDMRTVLERIAGYVPALQTYLDDHPDTTSYTPLTRGAFTQILYDIHITIEADQQAHMYTETQKTLDAARHLREKNDLSSYTLIQQMSCFCPEAYTRPIQYEVISGSIDTDTRIYADDDTPLSGDMQIQLHTIEGAFDIIQQAIDDQAESIDVTYHKLYGYPLTIAIDQSAMIADEEQYYTFTLEDVKNTNDPTLATTRRLTAYDVHAAPSQDITLTFDGERISASICNQVSANYLTHDGNLLFDSMISTEMFCGDELLMEIEQAFTALDVVAYATNTTDLVLETSDHTFVRQKQ